MGSPSHAEALIKTCSEIVSELAKAHEANESINLNSLRLTVAKKHKLQGSPRLVDIIAAVPESLRPVLLPKLKAKPIRTASGVGPLISIYRQERLSPEVQIAVVAVMSKPHRCPHIAVTGNICVSV